MSDKPILPHVISDIELQKRGGDFLAEIFGSVEKYFDFERDGQAAFLNNNQCKFALNTNVIWNIINNKYLDVSRNEIRLVKTDVKGLNILNPSTFVDNSGIIPDPQKVRQHFSEGATLAIQLLDRYYPPLNQICTALSAFLGHPCQFSAYLTPPSAQGLDIHHDTHDVVVLQLEGIKRFYIYPVMIERPIPSIHLESGVYKKLQPKASYILNPGDVLYIPRGVPHRAETSDSKSSLHLTLGILAITWASLIKKLADELYFIEYLNRSCPVRALYKPHTLKYSAQEAAQQLADWIKHFGAERLASIAAQTFVESFAMRSQDDNFESIVAIDPDPFGGANVVTPHNRRRLDQTQLRQWYQQFSNER